MSALLHQSLKDLRQLRWLVLAWSGAIVARALLVAYPFDARSPRLADHALGDACSALGIAHLALLVVIAVLIVQADPGVGSTGFWLTRPIGRAAMIASKLLSATLVLVVAPVAANLAVLAAIGLPLSAVWQAARQGTMEHFALILPAMGMASLTADLAGFVLAAAGTLAVFVVLVVAAAAGPDPAFSRGASESAALLAMPFAAAWGGLVVSHQYLTRRRTRSIVLAVVGMGLLIAGARWWPWDVLRAEPPLAAGTLHANAVQVSVPSATEGPVVRVTQGRAGTTVSARITVASPEPTVVVSPIAADGRLETEGRELAVYRGEMRRERRTDERLSSGNPARGAMAAALGGVRILAPKEAQPGDWLPLVELPPAEQAAASSPGVRYHAEVALRAIRYEALPDLPLKPGVAGGAGDRRFTLLDAACDERGCDVVVRDVVAAFLYDTRPLSRVDYLLVNRRAGIALVAAELVQSVLGPLGYSPTTEHLAITRRHLRFEVAPASDVRVDGSWLAQARLVPVVARDLGVFSRPLEIPDFGALLRNAGEPPRAPQGVAR